MGGATYTGATILVEQYQHSAVREGDGGATDATLEFEPAAACTRLRENAHTIGLVVLRIVRAHLGTVGRVLSAQALGREDGLTVGLVIPFAVRLV